MKHEESYEDLEQVELEIEALLKDFEGETIHIPEARLENALEDKLKALQKPKKYKLAKVATSIGILLLAGTLAIPQVQVFAKEVIESLFRDRGIEKAAQAGYPTISEVEGMIGEYKIKLFNIYIDAMRLSFDAEVIGLPEEEKRALQQLSYFLNIDDDWAGQGKEVDEVVISSSSFNSGEITNIEVQGAGVANLLSQDEIQIPLKLQSSKYSAEGENGCTLIGKTTLTLIIPEALRQPAKMYALDERVPIEKGEIHFEQLEVSPTMMTVSYKSHLEEGYITGLEGLRIVGSDKDYSEQMSTSSSFDEQGGVIEYIIPSIYFENGKQFAVQAEGYTYKKDILEEIIIDQKDPLPKEITYDGIPLTITTFNHQDGLLEVSILDANPKGHSLNHILINGISNEGMRIYTHNYESEDSSKTKTREYSVKIKVPEAESYKLALEFTLQKEEAIVIPIELE